MAKPGQPELAILQQIADALGIPVEWLFTDSLPVDADECLRLWFIIRTQEARCRALDALTAIADEATS